MYFAYTSRLAESPESLLRMFLARDRTVVELTAEVKRLQLSRGLDDSQKVQVLVHAIVDPDQPKKVPGQFKQNAKYLKEVCAILQVLGASTDEACLLRSTRRISKKP